MQHTPNVTVVGGGLAGSEAAWQLAIRGHAVRVVEMRPVRSGPAHHGSDLAELVCSNSFRSDDPDTASGLLKWELEELGSLVMAAARVHAVPAGAALAVDRDAFARSVTEALQEHPLVEIERREVTELPTTEAVIIASGPLTSEAFETALGGLTGASRLHFYDAAAPIVDAATIDMDIAFSASRYGKGEGADYLNLPLNEHEYEEFIAELLQAERVQAKAFETADLFQACQPIEEIARRGPDAPRFGAMKPVGLTDPRTGHRPFAVVQLRAETREHTSYNLVGFQTNLTFPAQRRVFGKLPGLKNAEFLRFGVMHRNTYIDAPRVLSPTLALRSRPDVWLAGQLIGTEGYLEAAAGGLLAALNVDAALTGAPPVVLPGDTVLGALIAYATDPETDPYQPMHVNFGIIPPLDKRVKGKRPRYRAYADRARTSLRAYLQTRADLRPGALR